MTQEIYQIDGKNLADDHARSLISRLSETILQQPDQNTSTVSVTNILNLNRNLYDKNLGEMGKTLSITGSTYTITDNAAHSVSEKMPVLSGAVYVASQTTMKIIFLDKNDQLVGNVNAVQVAWTDINVPSDATHAIIALANTVKDKMNFGLKNQLNKLNYGVVNYPPNESRLLTTYPSSTLSGKRCVWMGTSIPWGGGHPEFVCGALGMQLTNVAQGHNRIRAFNSNGSFVGQDWLVKMFTLTKAEVNSRYSGMLGKTVKTTDYLVEDASGVVLTQAMLDALTEWSFESKVEPIITDNDVFVLEFAVNDINGQAGDFEFAKDSGLDRSKYAGAHNYVINKILTQKPDARIIIVGHFTSDNAVYANASKFVAAQLDIAEYWNIPIVNLSKYAGVNALTKSLTRANDGIHFDPGTVLGYRIANTLIRQFAEIGI